MDYKLRLLTLCCLLLSLTSFSQQAYMEIKGTVTDAETKQPVPGASVYLDQTTKGTTTTENGTFNLKVPSGNYNLVVSYVGYKSLSIPVNAQNNPLLKLQLQPANNLKEVTITADSKWEEYLMLFKMFFLGRTGTESTIVNPKVLSFKYSKTYVLTAEAREPLIIENQALGYKVYYDLSYFSHYAGRTSYTGHTHFEEMTPKDKKEQAKWLSNRENSYYGSSAHFMRALVNKHLKEEGFSVKILERTRTSPSNYPIFERWKGDEYKAPDTIVTMRWTGMDYSPQDTTVLTAEEKKNTDKWGSKAEFNVLYPGEVSYERILKPSPFEGYSILSFPRLLFITYKKKKSPNDFWGYGAAYRPSLITSIISLLRPQTTLLIDDRGNLSDPNEIMNEGYWAASRVAHQLPSDYVPEEKPSKKQ
jgi:hypothetical protein